MTFKIGDRVRRLGNSTQGTVGANPYEFGGVMKCAVIWDYAPKHLLSVDVSQLVLATEDAAVVPEEARPFSVGALSAPERRFA